MLTTNLIVQLAGPALSDLPSRSRRRPLEASCSTFSPCRVLAVIVRHWFEIDLDDSSMEHGVRVELRELADHSHRGSESAAQLVTLDRPLWRADLFDRHTDVPGSFGVAHYHAKFLATSPVHACGTRS